MKISDTNCVIVAYHELPNGAYAATDGDNKLVAYNRNGQPKMDWSWVRSDCRK